MSRILEATALLGAVALLAACGGNTADPTSYATSADAAGSVAHQVADNANCGNVEDLGPLPADPKTWGFSCRIGSSNFQIDVFGDATSATARQKSLGSDPRVFKKTYLAFSESGASDHLADFGEVSTMNAPG